MRLDAVLVDDDVGEHGELQQQLRIEFVELIDHRVGIGGAHLLWPSLEPRLRGTRHDYRELDPDVFGEELERPAYAQVERIAVVALDVFKL